MFWVTLEFVKMGSLCGIKERGVFFIMDKKSTKVTLAELIAAQAAVTKAQAAYADATKAAELAATQAETD